MAGFRVKVESVDSSVSLGKSIQLKKLMSSMGNAEYEKGNSGVVYKIEGSSAAALVFPSGKIVCTGAKSIEESQDAAKKTLKRLESAGVQAPGKHSIKIENIVATSNANTSLNLGEISFALKNAEYEPGKFPGLVYRAQKSGLTFMLFSSGRIICTGAQRLSDIQSALDTLKKKLESI